MAEAQEQEAQEKGEAVAAIEALLAVYGGSGLTAAELAAEVAEDRR